MDLNAEIYVSRDNLDNSPVHQLDQLGQIIQSNNAAIDNNQVQVISDHFHDCDGPVD